MRANVSVTPSWTHLLRLSLMASNSAVTAPTFPMIAPMDSQAYIALRDSVTSARLNLEILTSTLQQKCTVRLWQIASVKPSAVPITSRYLSPLTPMPTTTAAFAKELLQNLLR